MSPKRYPANGQSGGRGAAVWVLLSPAQIAWLARNPGGSLTATSMDGETVRLSYFQDVTQLSLEGGDAEDISTLTAT